MSEWLRTSADRTVGDSRLASTIETDVYEGGSLVLHIVDDRTDGNVWVAWGEANVEPAFISPDDMRRWVYRLVGELFEDWPRSPGR